MKEVFWIIFRVGWQSVFKLFHIGLGRAGSYCRVSLCIREIRSKMAIFR